jgi:hypothetical protein
LTADFGKRCVSALSLPGRFCFLPFFGVDRSILSLDLITCGSVSCGSNNYMITFDPAKDQTNRNKPALSLAEADFLDWSAALIWRNDREDRSRAGWQAAAKNR